MKKKKVIVIWIVILAIIPLISFSKFILAKPVLMVREDNTNIGIQLTRRFGNNFSVDINKGDIQSIDYLKGYILYTCNKKNGNNFDLYNGDKNVQVYSMNNNAGGVYIKAKTGNYLISATTISETLKMYDELKENKNFEVKYKEDTDADINMQ
ncbi:hypothetical protein [uncultured Clostridium sp.]|uniref:hypothetical protein n=1 Tax=uncultured Clostridium sp. TaxID=59620 RepID=UPI002623D72B|nr:hypothetical protein [uncultured Clostridium sp.]